MTGDICHSGGSSINDVTYCRGRWGQKLRMFFIKHWSKQD
jgi:hypothetical protein